MKFSILLLSASGLASARMHPYLYGVPKAPGLEAEELAITNMPEAMENSTSINGTEPRPPPMPTAPPTPALAEPCAMISSSLQALPSGERRVVSADLGMQCLRSVPLDTEGNIQLIDDLKLYIAWQSNLGFLKNPPPEYTEQPVDIVEEMNSMQEQLKMGGYESEYDFQNELTMLFNRAYDNHLAWQPDMLAGILQFQRAQGTELVSVSSDGVALPEVFAFRDLEKARNDRSFVPSPVRTINGQGVEEYLQSIAVQTDFHDADTRWNALFPSQPLMASGISFFGAFRTGEYQGPNTTMAFSNGTSKSWSNIAVVVADFEGVDSGQAFFDKFCRGPQAATPTAAPAPPTVVASANLTVPSSTSVASTSAPSHAGYPSPVILHPNLSLGGYYINDTGYDDIAVLSVPSYESADVQLFQNIMRDFIRESAVIGKTKLIFDFRGNGGGNAILGYDTFKQVYPQAEQEPFGATRYRANEALNMIGKVTEEFEAGRTFVQENQTAFVENFGASRPEDISLYTASFNAAHQLDIDNEQIGSWEQLFGPQDINGDQYTTTVRYNFSDEISYTYPGFSVIGYLNNTNETATPQPFETQNIVMLHDGMCSSTCTIASELLKNQGGVRTIAIGGRPRFGPMQGIGGTKGAQSFNWDDVQIRAQIVYFTGTPEQQEQWNNTALGRTAFARQIFTRSAYANGRPAGGINLRDNLRQDDDSQTPLEFIYEAADCRMWYTAPMINDVTEVWKGVADRMFRSNGTEGRGMQACVQGSTGDKSSVTGGGQARSGEVPPPPPPPREQTSGQGGNSESEEESNAGVTLKATSSWWWIGTFLAVLALGL